MNSTAVPLICHAPLLRLGGNMRPYDGFQFYYSLYLLTHLRCLKKSCIDYQTVWKVQFRALQTHSFSSY